MDNATHNKTPAPIYLDFAATTPVDERVVAKMIPCLAQQFGNPAGRSHDDGWQAEEMQLRVTSSKWQGLDSSLLLETCCLPLKPQ